MSSPATQPRTARRSKAASPFGSPGFLFDMRTRASLPVLSNRAFIRAWSARRAQVLAALAMRNVGTPPPVAGQA